MSSTGPSWTHHLVVAFQLFFESLRPVARLLAIFFFMVSSHYTPNCSANTWLTVLTFMIIRRTTFKDKVLSVLASFIIFLFFLLARKGCGRRCATLIGKGSGSISTSHSGKSEQCVQRACIASGSRQASTSSLWSTWRSWVQSCVHPCVLYSWTLSYSALLARQ